ncbi:MAG: UvrD-helicase domain-containing protein [Deltaproteobacteria bacterium]|nr:UvrD-helicase domain-containing protein [Deltaproteobacteria bacterium]
MNLASPDALRRSLNPSQWEAVSHTQGPLLILAGAGSGKTRVLTYRIAYLVAHAGVDPRAILAVTFTNKAAREMRHRVEGLLGSLAAGAWIGTFHGVCLRILRGHANLLDVGPDFGIYDADDQKRLSDAVVKELGLDPKRFSPTSLLHRAQRAKDEGQGPEDLPAPGANPYARAQKEFFTRYQARLREARALDFGDILLETLRLFQAHPEVGDQYRRRFAHLLIDEYQDTNRVQYLLVREISRGHGNVCVVGDDDQSIYGWRGADLRNILSFEEEFPGATIVKLEQNYRSTQAILDAASAVVSRNVGRHPKVLWTERAGGEPLTLYAAPTEEEEAAWVAETILELRRRGLAYSDTAILYRMHALSRPFEEAFLRRRIPYVVYGGLRFYDRKEIKDALAYLRLVLNPDDPAAFQRIVNTPARGIGKSTVDRILEEARRRGTGLWAAVEASVEEGLLPTRQARPVAAFAALVRGWREALGTVPLRELLARIVEEAGYVQALKGEGSEEALDRLENLEELLNAAESFERHGAEEPGGAASPREFLDRSALVSDQDLSPDRADVVTLMTLHAAKGLEYSVVFLTGLEEGVFPHDRSSHSDDELEEERRLCYVGLTRAKDRLFLTRARVRRVYGAESFFRPPSRFLSELPAAAEPAELRAAAVPAAARPPERGSSGHFFLPEPGEADYREGMRVRHARYGLGSVERVEGRGPSAKVHVRFADAGTKKFIASLAGLEVEL